MLRVMGASLAAAAIPGVRPSIAGAAPNRDGYTCNPNVETCCDKDERVCHKDAPVPQNKGYCCPAPSWRWGCGSEANGYTCVDQCGRKHLFPCTGRRPDKFSGVNGLCCDDRYHSRCDPDAKPPLSGGGSRPMCVPKTCGPDITAALEDVLSRVEARFEGWGSIARAQACNALISLPLGLISWDINQLGPGGRERLEARYRPDCSTCGSFPTVQVGSDCNYTGSVNYALFGVMMRLCHDHYHGVPAFADWFSQNAMFELIAVYKSDSANFQASNAWAQAGYRSSALRPAPVGDRKLCGPCSKPFSERLTFKWLPLVVAG